MAFVLMILLGDFSSKLFPSFSKDAYDINVLFLRYLIFCAFITILIGAVMIAAIIKFREKKNPGEPEQIFGHKKLEITWTIFPFIIVILFFVLTLELMLKQAPSPKNRKPDIVVISRQWWWDLRYPGQNVITANELHIPVGKRLLMRVESADVVHDWWVQDLGPKIDAVPGQPNYTWIAADKPGIYLGTCSEYCGTQHAWMRITVVAESQENFNKWIAHQQENPGKTTDSIAKQGADIFQKKTCLNCHSVTMNPDDAAIGPNLSHMGSRLTLLSGMKKNTKENLEKWLQDPQKVKSGALMPNFMLKKDEVNALTEYLEGLK